MTTVWTRACCTKDAQQLGNILYCFKCGATKAVAIGTPPEEPLQAGRRKYDGFGATKPARPA